MKILLVEDFGPLRLAVAQCLREAGHVVDDTADGKEAEWMIRENEYAVVVLDIMLPGRTGLELLEVIRQRDIDSGVLIITARDAVEDRVQGLDLGADDYLVKPFSLEELQARVRALLRRQFHNRSPVIRVGSLEIDTLQKVARREGIDLDLTAKEYAMLEYLGHRAGEVVSREDVWEQLYDMNFSRGTSNVVDVFISKLRKKIDQPGVSSLIQTRRGRGYVLANSERT